MKINTTVIKDRLEYFVFGYEKLADKGISEKHINRIIQDGKCSVRAAGHISEALQSPLTSL